MKTNPEESTTKKIARNFSWLIFGEMLGKLFGFVSMVYIARILGSEAFGWLNFAQAFLAYLLIIVDSGFPMFGIREIAKAKEKVSVISLNVIFIRFLISIFVFLLSAGLVWMLHIDPAIKLLFIGTFLYVFFRAFEPYWIYQGLEKMEYAGTMRIMQSGLNLVLILIFIRSASDLAKIPLLAFASGMTVNVLYLFVLYKYFALLKFDHFIPKEWANYYTGAFPLGVSAVLIQIYYNLDTIMLGFMGTQEKVGLYNAAYKGFLVILFILGIWQSTVFPVISRKLDEDRDQAAAFLGKYFRLTILACVPVTFLTTLVAPAIIMLIFGGRYAGATIALQILIWNLIPIAISGTFGTLILIPLGLTKEVLWAVGCGALLNVILNFILIPTYGFVGASFATLMAEIAVAIVTYFMAMRVLKMGFIGHTLKALFGSGISCAAAVLFLFLFPGMGFFVKYILAGGLFLFVYLIFLVLAGDAPFLMQFAREILSARKG